MPWTVPPPEEPPYAQESDDGHAPVASESGAFVSPNTNRRYRVLTAADARAERPPIESLIDGVILPNSLGIWVGAFGVGKTWALLDMGVCMAMGVPWLSYSVHQGGVLIVDEESGERRLSDRVKMALDGHEAPNDVPLFYTSFNNFNFFGDGAKSGGDLGLLIKRHDIKLVIIDALTDVAMPAKEKDSEEMGLVMKTLRIVSDLTRASIQLLHHENKMGDYRGSTNIPALADLVIGMKKEAKSSRLDFRFIKARDVEAFEFSAEMNFTPGRFWLSPANAPARSEVFSKSEAYVMRALADGPAGIDALMDGADTCSSEAARRAVYSLAQRGKIRRANPGARGAPATYELIHNGKEGGCEKL